VEKASLLERERRAVQKLRALNEIAVALSSTLDVNEVALTVAQSIHRLFGATRVMIARYDAERATFVPLHVLDEGELTTSPAIPADETIMGLAVLERTPVQRVRPKGPGELTSIDPFTNKPVALLAYEADLFAEGIGTGVAVPVIQDGVPVGALWLGYAEAEPLSEQTLSVLSSIGLHVAIATKNAQLFQARNQALEDLQAAQDKLVQAEKLNAIGLIAHGVAHDFNNVLGSILGRAQLLKSQLRDTALVKHVEVIEKSAEDGAETVRRIQEIGRQDRVDDFVGVGLNDIVEDVVEQTQPRWRDLPLSEGRPIEMAVSLSPDAPRIAANPHEMREVLVNLVHNAVDAMPQGGRIELSTRKREDGVSELSVRDTGTGMPEHVKHKIFDPYFTTKGERGTGLGLSVSMSIVRRHGGTVEVFSSTSGPERGTTFVLSFPGIAHVEDKAPAQLAAGNGARAHVLVVDDERNIREILAEILAEGGHTVVTAADGAEALHRLREDDSFDLVFTDLGLPGMSGYEVASEVKKIRPNLPVGLVTGWGATLDADKAREHGVDLVISKPFRFEQVLGLVDEAMLLKGVRGSS
jgi:signal transduction histidine kinase/ActR/RegA family two-component response regulator